MHSQDKIRVLQYRFSTAFCSSLYLSLNLYLTLLNTMYPTQLGSTAFAWIEWSKITAKKITNIQTYKRVRPLRSIRYDLSCLVCERSLFPALTPIPKTGSQLPLMFAFPLWMPLIVCSLHKSSENSFVCLFTYQDISLPQPQKNWKRIREHACTMLRGCAEQMLRLSF